MAVFAKLYLCIVHVASIAATSNVGINVGDKHVRAEFSPGFASVTIDFHPGSQGKEWGVNASILEVDLKNPSLISAASALAPAILRLGGSEAGSMVIYTDFPRDRVNCPSGFYYCLSSSRWNDILAFSEQTGVRLMFDLNIIGPNKTANWTAQLSNIASLFEYTSNSGVRIAAWEIGNENQFDLSPLEAARRVRQVRSLLNKVWSKPDERPLLIGPSVHIETDWIIDFLGHIDDDDISVFSYHLYAGFGGTKDIKEQMAAASFLDESRELVQSATWASHFVRPALPLMLTETAAAWDSGVSGGTNAFVSSFWYLDTLAFAASNGHFAFARQTLIGGNYSLIDQNHDYRANPDFFVARLWRQLVEGDGHRRGRVLQCLRPPVIAYSAHHEIRSHAFCGENNTLLLAVMNIGTDSQVLEVKFDDTRVTGQGRRDEYVLQAQEDGSWSKKTVHVQSRRVTLNGKAIESVMGLIPQLLPRVVDDSSYFQAPALSVSFVRFPLVQPKACLASNSAALLV